ncbi:hypothetical protein K1719_000933 [Acacia pycnantha]|nr:hypothetical protein K1719_000933 [Acacia pycnantha]
MREFHHFTQVLRRDVEFIKKGINKGVEWANEAFRIPMVTKKINDLIWLRNLKDPQAPQFSTPSWPQHWFPGCSLDFNEMHFINFANFLPWKIFSAFASAVIRIQTSGVTKFIKPNPEEDVDVKTSQYNFGTVLKETMLSLGPTFIKDYPFKPPKIVLHWHIIGKQSFPLEMPSYPKLWKGSYTKWERYTVEDAYEIVK